MTPSRTKKCKARLKPATFDLRQAESICSHLKETTSSCDQNRDNPCLGYLETADLFKFLFYRSGTGAVAGGTMNQLQNDVVSLLEIIQVLPMLNKLELAHKLARSTLQYHSTSWLSQDWHLQNLSFFSNRPEDLRQVLQDLHTLHFSVGFPEIDSGLIQPMEGVQLNDTTIEGSLSTVEDAKIHYGIRNMTLTSLGLALLEIGYQRDLQSLSTTRDRDHHKVVTARRLLEGQYTQMGSRYQNIVRKCIHCDFALGQDLDSTELQSAVYNEVVCPLEEMIRGYQQFSTA